VSAAVVCAPAGPAWRDRAPWSRTLRGLSGLHGTRRAHLNAEPPSLVRHPHGPSPSARPTPVHTDSWAPPGERLCHGGWGRRLIGPLPIRSDYPALHLDASRLATKRTSLSWRKRTGSVWDYTSLLSFYFCNVLLQFAAMPNMFTMVLAGGKGERLQPLTEHRAKPAVPFGGKYRIIDFTLSNCLNSGLRKVAVLIQ
jgi:hypothetical protein